MPEVSTMTRSKPESLQAGFGIGLGVADGGQAFGQWQVRAQGLGLDRQPVARQPRPVEMRAGVDLAAGRHVGMADHRFGSDGPPGHDPRQQKFQRVHLGGGEGTVAGIGDLDPDAAGIYVILTPP